MHVQQVHAPAATIDVVIVNWNSGGHLRRCVASLQQAGPSLGHIGRIVVIDNASSDGSQVLENPPELRIEIVQNTHNSGFAASCNQGAARCNGPLLLFLNPDVELEPGTLVGLGERFVDNARPEIGIVGVRLVDANGQVQRSCARRPTSARMIAQALAVDRLAPWLLHPHFMSEWNHGDTRIVDQVIGAFMLMRRTDFERLGGFDERFFVYMEDVDLAARARQMGLRSLYVHDRQARHVGGGTTEGIRDIRLAYLMRSRVLYARKHFGGLATFVVTMAILMIEPVVRLVQALGRGRLSDAMVSLTAARLCWQRYPFNRKEEQSEITVEK